MDDENDNEYRWETGYEKTWESITDDGGGLMGEFSVAETIAKGRRKRLMDKAKNNVRLGMMRHLFVVLDLSEAMQAQELKPTRLRCSLKLLEDFTAEYFYLNPISQLGLITTKDKRAEVWSEMAGNPKRHSERMRELSEAMGGNSSGCRGEPSLQNALETALATLKHLPAHASREVLVVMGSLTTCDPGDVEATINKCRDLHVRCSVISLAAEVRILKELTKRTGGEYGVILDDCHFRDLLHAHLEPPPTAAAAEASLIRMGFPCHSGMNDSGTQSGLGMCMCHLDATVTSPNHSNSSSTPSTSLGKLSSEGFLCPQCNAKYCELPVECRCCGLTLVSAPHLARSYHHLFPLPPFDEVVLPGRIQPPNTCFSCLKALLPKTPTSDVKAFKCPTCAQIACTECDLFIHETLHSCPGCASRPPPPPSANGSNGASAAMARGPPLPML